MSRKPSQRSNIENNDPKELNMIPYLDIVTNIIMFMLFTSTAIGAIGVINVASPKIGGGGAGGGGPEKPPLNLSVFITSKGFSIAATGGVMAGSDQSADGKKGPTIPKTGNQGDCDRMGKKEQAPCYDYSTLTKKMQEIKKVFTDETKVNLAAEADVPYYVLINTMDATRENPFERDDMGKPKPLFYDVILAAGL